MHQSSLAIYVDGKLLSLHMKMCFLLVHSFYDAIICFEIVAIPQGVKEQCLEINLEVYFLKFFKFRNLKSVVHAVQVTLKYNTILIKISIM